MNAQDRATEIVEECWDRIERGEPVDPEDVVRAHPDLADELRSRFETLRRLDRTFPRAAAAPSLVGAKLGAYRVASQLGAGGMGTVYSADVATADARRVALKVVHPHLLAKPGFFKRFLREAELGRRIRHENVVATLDVDAAEIDGRLHHFLVMEHVEGQTLRDLLDEVQRLPEELCRHVGRETAKALAAVHAAGAVHRDLKPENVLITPQHVVKVMDLGVAWLDEEALRLSQTGAFVGSVRYAAPEQFRGRDAPIDGRADLYALGLVLYELATGAHPFAGDDFHVVLRRQLDETPRPAGELNPQLSAFFEELLRTLLAKAPEERFASASALLDVLEQGERSAWWRDRAIDVRARTKRPLRRIRIPRETALYGRDAELAKLRSLFEAAKAGEGQVVLVEGEAGIGKSRLVDEFVGLLQREGEDLNFLFGGNDPGGAATASGAFSTAYREHFGAAGLEETLASYLVETPVLVPAFAALLKGETPPPGTERLTKDSLQTVFVHATRRLAAERPTVVLIEDLHFAPEEGRALFASLALAVPGHRVLLVGTTRPGVPESWTAGIERLGHASRMALPRLGPKQLARLLVDAFRSERLAEELSFKIAAKSDGNPYFVFELIRGLREGQFIKQRPDGTWVTTQVIHDIEVPSTVKDLIGARIADLDAEDKDVLDVASCLGFEFDAGLVADALGVAHVPVLRRLARIEAKHRLVRSAGDKFAFDHHQVQETLHAGLPPPLARAYHGAIAEAIERSHQAKDRDPQQLDGAVCVDLAEHFLKGGQGARALRYLDPALTHLEKGYLNDAAIDLADRVLAAPGLVAGRGRAELLLRKAERLESSGRRDAQRAALDEAIALADAEGDGALRARTRLWLGRLLRRVSRNDEAVVILREAEGLARAAGDRKTEGHVLGDSGCALLLLDRYAEARERLERFLVIARQIGDRHGEARASGDLGLLLRLFGHHAQARESQERRVALARQIGDRRGEGVATENLGDVSHAEGRLAEAWEHGESCLAIVREIGERRSEVAATSTQGRVLGSLGRLAESREQHERSLALAREIGDRTGEGIALQCLGDLAAGQGEHAAAARHFAAALDLRRSIGQRADEAQTLCSTGALLARLDRTDEARAALRDALAIALELSLPGVNVLAAAWLAWVSNGDVGAAIEALTAYEARADTEQAMEARFLVWQATHDPAHLAEAKRRLDFLVEHAPPDCRESMLANVRLHREIAQAAARHAG